MQEEEDVEKQEIECNQKEPEVATTPAPESVVQLAGSADDMVVLTLGMLQFTML